MSPLQHELYARTVLDDHHRQAARFRPDRPGSRGWRDRFGTALVAAGDHLRAAGRRLQHVPDAPVTARCADT